MSTDFNVNDGRRPVEPEAMPVEPEAIAKLSRPGPRYTSYPTVLQWVEDFDGDAWASRLAVADTVAEPISLYFHLPFCRERCYYCGCNVVITGRQHKADRYIDYLAAEMELVAARLAKRREVAQLHYGGGTPTFLDEAQLQRLWNEITSRFTLSAAHEVAVEIDPRVTTRAQLSLLRRQGFNRVSLGVQDLDAEVQQEIGRVQSLEQTADLLRFAREIGYRGINVDLIFGLPKQRVERFRETVEQVIALAPDRVAMFSYAHVPWIHPHQRRFDPLDLPDAMRKIELFQAAKAAFEAAGYLQIGMDHFARADDELGQARAGGHLGRNFQGYTPRPPVDTVAFGVSAISDAGGAYAQNVKGIADYYRRLDSGELPVERGWVLTDDDRLRREVINEVMCNFVADLERLAGRHGRRAVDCFTAERAELERLVAEGLVELDDWTVTLTPLGRAVVRNVAMIFDAYMERLSDAKPRFSQTV